MNDAAIEAVKLDPNSPESWIDDGFEPLYAMSWRDCQEAQLAALIKRFEQFRHSVAALDKLAKREGISSIGSIEDALPLLFDHRIYKSYPLSIIERRDIAKLNSWLDRLTTHDLSTLDLSGLTMIDDWLDRLDDFGMLVGTSSGTTGKLSFVPRSLVEWPGWDAAYNEATRAATGVDSRRDFVPTFFPGYRGGHQMALKMQTLFMVPASGGPEEYHTLYQTALSSDLMSLAARLQAAEDKGELDRLGLDPALLAKRDAMIEQGRRRHEDLEAWFAKLIEDYRGRRVRIGGTAADLLRAALSGRSNGLKCDFAPGSFIISGGGMKGYKDAPPDWESQILDFFGVDRICGMYGMSESMGSAPLCSHGFYHFRPFTVVMVLDDEMRELPREGVQSGRLAVFDLLAETYWGGFVTGDRVRMHWDEDCGCGWKGPRIEQEIARSFEAGGDDKISCAGSAQAYNEFMDFVSQV